MEEDRIREGKEIGEKGKVVRRVTEKMRSQNGMSLVLALIFFLACALSGSMLLAIARTYEKRMVAEAKETEYLAAFSAAEFLKSQLDGCQGSWSLDETKIIMEPDIDNKVQRELLETICKFCKGYETHPAGIKKELSLTFTLEDEKGESRIMPEIQVRITIESDAKADATESKIPIELRATLSLEGEENRIMRLTAMGIACYEDGESLELYWEEMETGR